MEQGNRPTPRAEIIFVIVLFAIMAAMIAGVVLQERGLWPSPEATLPVYQVLWGAMWVPGMVVLGVLFLRIRKLSLLLGISLQVVTIALVALRLDQLKLATTVGTAGLVLPLIWAGIATPEPLRTRLPTLAVLLAMPPLAGLLAPNWDHIDAWNLALPAMVFVAVMIPYAVMLWPGLQSAIEEDARKQQEWWSKHPWLNRGLKASAVALALVAVWMVVETVLICRGFRP